MHSTEQSNNRFVSIDLIRVLAMLMVVVLHTILNFTIRTDFFATPVWFLLEPIVALSKIGVLLFFMISGFLVLNLAKSIGENLTKAKKRIVIPLLFFSAVTILIEYARFMQTEQHALPFWQAQLMRITNFPSSPLWFLVVLLFLYALNPLWQLVFLKDKSPAVARYCTSLALVFTIVAAGIKYPSLKADIFFNALTGWLGYVFFYFYGGLVKNGWIQTHSTKTNLGLVALGLFATMLGDYFTAFAHSHSRTFIWDGYFSEFLSVPVIIMAIGAFNLLTSARVSDVLNRALSRLGRRIIVQLAELSYGVYLIHTFVVTALYELGFDFNNLTMNAYIFSALNYSLVFGISLIVTYVVRKIPLVRAVVGE